jgi:hypothetical protein
VKKKKILLQAGSNYLTLNFKKMKKFVLLLLISMISSFGVFAKSSKHKVKKAVAFAGCTVYPITKGKVQIGDMMVCEDLKGRITVIKTYYQ